MGLLDWLVKKGRQTQAYIASTIRTSERLRSYSAYDPDAAKAISMAFGVAQIAATRVSDAVAAVPLRLYKPASASAGPGKVRPVGTATKRYLQCVGVKAATYRADDDLEEVTDHPVLDFLARPNAYQSGWEFRHLNATFKQLTGSSYVLPDAQDLEMHLLFPQYVRVVAGKARLVDAFIYGRSNETDITFDADEVWWTKIAPSPFSPLKGWGRLSAVFTEQEIFAAINQTELAVFDNTGRPDYLVNIEGGMSQVDLDALKAELDAKHRGPANSGRPFVVGNTKATITPLGWPMKDMGNIELRRQLEADIAMAFGVPESEIRVNDANLASSSTGNKQFLRQTVMPLATQDAEDFTRWVVEDMFGLDGWCLAPENVVGSDYAQEVITLSTLLGSGVVSINEARLATGYEAIDDPEADKLRISGVPLAQSGQQADPFGGFPVALDPGATIRMSHDQRTETAKSAGRPEAAEEAGLHGVGDAAPPQREDVVRASEAGTAEGCCAEPGCGCGHAGHRSVKALWEADAKAFLKEIKPEDASPYRDDEPATIRLYRKVKAALEARRDEILSASAEKPFGLDKRSVGMRHKATDDLLARLLSAWGINGRAATFAEALAGATEPEAEALFNSGVDAGVAQVGEWTEVPALDNSRTVAFFDNFKTAYIRGLASVDETTAAAVERAIRERLEDGDNLRGIQGAIREAFNATNAEGQTMTEWRAAMVARSETARATVQGRLGGYAAAGVARYKFLLAPNSCEYCEAVERKFKGKEIAVGEPLFRQGSELQGADGGTMTLDFDDTVVPIHPNCRCDIVPVVG